MAIKWRDRSGVSVSDCGRFEVQRVFGGSHRWMAYDLKANKCLGDAFTSYGAKRLCEEQIGKPVLPTLFEAA